MLLSRVTILRLVEQFESGKVVLRDKLAVFGTEHRKGKPLVSISCDDELEQGERLSYVKKAQPGYYGKVKPLEVQTQYPGCAANYAPRKTGFTLGLGCIQFFERKSVTKKCIR